MQIVPFKSKGVAIRGFGNGAFDPQTLVLLEIAFDEALLTLNSTSNKTVQLDELARAASHLTIEGERDPAYHSLSVHWVFIMFGAARP